MSIVASHCDRIRFKVETGSVTWLCIRIIVGHIDGIQQANLTGIDNDTLRIDRARLGALAGMDVGTSGTYYFDAFESRRQTYIGP